MTIALTGTGGIFTRLGVISGGLNELNAARGAALNTRDTTVRAQFQAAQQDVLDGLLGAKQSWQAQDDWATQLKTYAQNTLLRMARDDGWTGSTFAQALEYLRVQMVGAGTMILPDNSINKPTVTITPAAATGIVGNGTMRASLVSPIDGLALDYPLAETLSVVCTSHSYSGGSAVAGRETFATIGAVAARDPLAYEWPAGSGVAGTTQAVDDANNFVTDGAFETWVVNVPTYWTTTVGVATVSKGVAPYTGASCLRITGDGATLTRLEQTLAGLSPQRAYGFNLWMLRSAGLAAGVMRFRLVDATNAVINDEAGNPNEVNVTLSTLPTAWGATSIQGTFFRTPRLLPATVKLEVVLTTAITNTATLDLDRLSLAEADQAYNGGPFVKVFSGSVPFAVNDTFTAAVTNSFGTTKFARELDRLWDLRDNGVRIPSKAVGSISDALVV